MLLEAIFREIYRISEGIFGNEKPYVYELMHIDALIRPLIEIHPKRPEKPINIISWYKSLEEGVMFWFRYADESKECDMTFDELHQYFCTVLGEKEC